MKLLPFFLLNFFFLVCAFLAIVAPSIAMPQLVEIVAKRHDEIGPGSKKEFRFHFINHGDGNIRFLPFLSGHTIAVFLVDDIGFPVRYKRYSPLRKSSKVSYRRGNSILPGDHSGVTIPLQHFDIRNIGVYFIVCAIPKPDNAGVIFSVPGILSLSKEGIESCVTVSTDLIPSKVKTTFRVEISKRLREEEINFDVKEIPF